MQLNYTLSVPDIKAGEMLMPKIEAAVIQTAQTCVDDARAYAPAKTGFLRESIHYENVVVTQSSASVDVVASAYYAGFVEFGHMTRQGPRRRFVPGQPFLGPAAQLAEIVLVRNISSV